MKAGAGRTGCVATTSTNDSPREPLYQDSRHGTRIGTIVPMFEGRRQSSRERSSQLMSLFRAIASGNDARVSRLLNASPGLAWEPITIGARRADPESFYLKKVHHYVPSGRAAGRSISSGSERSKGGTSSSLVPFVSDFSFLRT